MTILTACASTSRSHVTIGPYKKNAGRQQDAGEGCPLTPTARQLLDQIAKSTAQETEEAVTDLSDDLQFMWSLVGVGGGARAQISLAVTCSGPSTQAETCLPPGKIAGITTVTSCFRTGCEGANINLVDVYSTQTPHHLADDRVSMSYSTTPPFPVGVVTYDPNPDTQWRIDFTDPAVTKVAARLQQMVTVVLSTGEESDLSFAGESSGTQKTFSGDWTTKTALTFAHVSAAGPVNLTMTNSNQLPWSGAVTIGVETLALITQTGSIWQGVCAAPELEGRDAGSD